MNKIAIAFVVLAVLVAALVSTAQVFAQGNTPANPQAPSYGNGGPMGGRGMHGGRTAAGDGLLHNSMIAVYAQELDITVEDLNARLAGGETIAQIAAEKGLSAEQFRALMADARSQAIDQAVQAGTLTQEQADWMKTRGAAAGNSGMRGAGRGGMRGQGAGMADCPYLFQNTP